MLFPQINLVMTCEANAANAGLLFAPFISKETRRIIIVSGQYSEGLVLIVNSSDLADCLRYKKSCFANLNKSDIKSDDAVASMQFHNVGQWYLSNFYHISTKTDAANNTLIWMKLLNNLT